jgi:hypothetical protein
MTINPNLLNIEFLVFSSHKTATQTITNSLNTSGVGCMHCHTLENIGLREGEFRFYLDEYRRVNAKKLQVISTFRDPLDRLVSSFFQSLSRDTYAFMESDKSRGDLFRGGDVNGPEDNIIYRISMQDLINLFYRYCSEIDGWGESLHLICLELGLSLQDLSFSGRELLGTHELDKCYLHLLRFDLLGHLPVLLSRITLRGIDLAECNSTKQKYYAQRYQEFRSCLRLSKPMITNIYETRRELIELFYPGQYQSILDTKYEQWS